MVSKQDHDAFHRDGCADGQTGWRVSYPTIRKACPVLAYVLVRSRPCLALRVLLWPRLWEAQAAECSACRFVTLPAVMSEEEMAAEIDPVYAKFLAGEVDVPGRDLCDMSGAKARVPPQRRLELMPASHWQCFLQEIADGSSSSAVLPVPRSSVAPRSAGPVASFTEVPVNLHDARPA